MDAKVLVVGLDGATFSLLMPWIEQGYLPTLATLMAEGAYGTLRSTIRPESSVAWSSFSTGVNPGKHGVFGFATYAPGTYIPTLTNATNVRSARLWDLLGHCGYRVGIVNVPLTYPPAAVNGVMVSGMLTPGPESTYTYPSDLKQRLVAQLGGYTGYMDIEGLDNNKETLVQRVYSSTEQQRRAALFLAHEFPCDLFVVVFTGPDRLQHFLWAEADPTHPLHCARTGSLNTTILDHYRFLDRTIGDLVEDAGKETIVLVLSDHGFNGCLGRFFVNAWLQAQGLLTWRKDAQRSARWLSSYTRLGIVPLLRRMKRFLIDGGGHSRRSLRYAVFARMIDWPRTRAYFSLDGGIRINLRGREPQGIVAQGSEYETLRHELREELQSVVDPETGQPVLDKVYFREELYHGPFLDLAPDLVIEPCRDSQDARRNYILDSSFPLVSQSVFGTSIPYTGNHTSNGIFCLWGQGIRHGVKISGASIVDLAPTLLYALQLPIPREMDGKVLTSVFDSGLLSNKLQYSDVILAQNGLPQEYDEVECEVVERRLRDLGYLN